MTRGDLNRDTRELAKTMESVAEKLRPEGTVTCWHKSRQSPIITKTDDARMNGFFNHSQLSASLGQLSKVAACLDCER